MSKWNNPQQISKSRQDAKIRVLAIERMLKEDRVISASKILRRLDLEYDIQADRKTIYADMAAINLVIPIDVVRGPCGGYKIWRCEEV